jgi:hypothetical protein
MILDIRVTPKAGKDSVKEENGNLKVYVTRPTQDGLANARVIELLAGYFNLKKYEIRIVRGEKSRNKSVQIPDRAKR